MEYILLNKINLGSSLDILKEIPDESIALTITSPPYYDSEVYILDDGTDEFGWNTYSEYLEHIQSVLDEILRVTIKSGRLVLVLSNSPQPNKSGQVVQYWPIIHDVVSYATRNGWKMIDEAIWVKHKRIYPDMKMRPVPESQLQVQHDMITILRKPGVYRKNPDTETLKIPSIWKIKHFGPISKYNHMYPSFPDNFVKRCLELWSLPDDIILDPYAGSGQVCRVALQLKRKTIGIEIDQQWENLWTDING